MAELTYGCSSSSEGKSQGHAWDTHCQLSIDPLLSKYASDLDSSRFGKEGMNGRWSVIMIMCDQLLYDKCIMSWCASESRLGHCHSDWQRENKCQMTLAYLFQSSWADTVQTWIMFASLEFSSPSPFPATYCMTLWKKRNPKLERLGTTLARLSPALSSSGIRTAAMSRNPSRTFSVYQLESGPD